MNTLPIDLSYLLLIGSIVLTAFIVQLPLLIKDYLHKRRKRNSSNIEWQEVHINMYGHVKRRYYQKIATGNYKARNERQEKNCSSRNHHKSNGDTANCQYEACKS